jgi:CRISPR-associated protein Cmr2
MSWYEDFLKKFFHDSIDKPFNIPSHEQRAKEYAEFFGIFKIEKHDYDYSDRIASCMERSLLPKGIQQTFTEIRHPLSDEKIEVKDFESNKVLEKFKSILQQIALNYEKLGDNEQKSLSIWRNLLENIKEKIDDEELKKYFLLLPADTRIPDHSIWEHLKITTAIRSFENFQNNSLFLFTIGPVKSFISQARKTQDFYMASFILSYLTFIAMEEVIEKYGPTSIIYPDLYKQPLMDWYLTKKKGLSVKGFDPESIILPTIPNRFVAIIGTTNEEEIKKLANYMIEKVKTEIKNAMEIILNESEINLSYDQKKILETQLSDFPQVYWVAIPWRKGNNDLKIEDLKDFFTDEKLSNWKELYNFATEKGEFTPNIGFLYQLLYTSLEKSMGSRKNLREFQQKEEAGRKCSICGERNTVFYRKDEESNPILILDNLKFFYGKNSFIKLDDKKISYKILVEKEGLCALCFLKRTFDIYLEKVVDNIFKDFSFPSTAEVACADFKEKAIKEAKENFNKYITEFLRIVDKEYLKVEPLPKLKKSLEIKKENNLEGSWFYEENLIEKKIKKELGSDIKQNELDKLNKYLESIHKKVGKPNPYYAVIYLDGDNMGKWLSGELLPEIQNAYNSEVWNNLPENFKKELIERLKKLNQENSAKKTLTPAIHSAISTALRNYAIELVRTIVEEEHLGKLIFAGGDDVMAFVNLKDLFDVMEKLRWAFSGQIKCENGSIKVDLSNTSGFVLKDGVYYLTMGKEATCSMGVVIAHYKEPLKIVIEKVFEIKEKAKHIVKEKNKFAILLMKKSGEERIGFAKWSIDNDLTTDILKKLKDWMDRNRKEKRYISDGFIQKFKIEFSKLKQISFSERIINTELKRLVKRAYNGIPREPKNEKEKFIKDFMENAIKILWELGGDIDNFINLLEIASFMNKGD